LGSNLLAFDTLEPRLRAFHAPLFHTGASRTIAAIFRNGPRTSVNFLRRLLGWSGLRQRRNRRRQEEKGEDRDTHDRLSSALQVHAIFCRVG
jgi:hypothetical protein